MIFFTSDTHFGHVNILKYCNRPFNSIEEHDEELIKRWNAKVSKNDIVYHLGDVGFGRNDYIKNILNCLNGTINLCIGNHDWRSIVKQQKWRFNEISQQYNLRIEGQHVILNHYPFLCYSGVYHKPASWQLFGHVHTSPYSQETLDSPRLKMLFSTQYDVGVDNNNFTPISFDEVSRIITDQQLSLGMYDKDNESLVE